MPKDFSEELESKENYRRNTKAKQKKKENIYSPKKEISSTGNLEISSNRYEREKSPKSSFWSGQEEEPRQRASTVRMRGMSHFNLKPEEKKVVMLEVESRKSNRLIYFLKWFVIGCRMFIVLSPSLTINVKFFKDNILLYHLNFFCSFCVFLKINLVLRKKRRHYFKTARYCIDYVANLGVFLCSLIYVINAFFELGPNALRHYYFWAACCFLNVVDILNHLKQFKLVSETFAIIMLALKLNYPFFYVIIIVYCIFASLGGYLFGGSISSNTPAQMEAVGQGTKEIYVYHNWNDFFNSMVFLYSINLNNNLPTYVNMSSVKDGSRLLYKMCFFFIFYLINNFILMNIFIGQIIEISLHYFKSIYQEAKGISIEKDDSKLNRSVSAIRVKV